MKTITITLPTIEEVDFTVECLDEHIPIRGNAIVSGDDDHDKEVEDNIIMDLNDGNPWAWCCIRVIARWEGMTGDDYLGGCSYQSEEDFTSIDGGYYQDMKQLAFDDLIKQIERLASCLD